MTLKEVIVITALYYERQMSPEVLEMQAGDLEDLDPASCINAYNQWRRNPKNRTFPLPAQIRELVCPDQFIAADTQASEIASRIVGAVTKYGWNNAREAQVFIGPEGWQVVNESGGWMHLCQNMGTKGLNPGVFQSQIKNRLEGLLTHGRAAVEQAIGVGTRRESPQLEGAGTILHALTGGKSNAETDGAV